ncbi:MAG: methionine biosynthesis protein MetW [Spirochaetae bacterium HGW-Spirochaetae-6]|nr:MAG: methionine biosynthesis protein MetW [Spirochaetae bacterium HGW-Spirochaetae-6]
MELVDSGSLVLDLGCGDGSLLEMLIAEKGVKGFGLEKDLQEINKCLAKGISVIDANLDQGLTQFRDKSMDYVILSLTLQALKQPHETLRDIIRVGKKAIISFPNFGNIFVRLYLLFRGRMPKSKFLPYEWYDTPNIHFCSVKDFIGLCQKEGIKIRKKIFLRKFNRKILGFMPNLFSYVAIFVLE